MTLSPESYPTKESIGEAAIMRGLEKFSLRPVGQPSTPTSNITETDAETVVSDSSPSGGNRLSRSITPSDVASPSVTPRAKSNLRRIIDDEWSDPASPGTDVASVASAEEILEPLSESAQPTTPSESEAAEWDGDSELQRVLALSRAEYDAMQGASSDTSMELDRVAAIYPKVDESYLQPDTDSSSVSQPRKTTRKRRAPAESSKLSSEGSNSSSKKTSTKRQKSGSKRAAKVSKPVADDSYEEHLPATYYILNQHYMDETKNMVIFGESEAPEPKDGESETWPVRILDDFVVYNLQSSDGKGRYLLAGLDCYHLEGYELRASGKVRPAHVDEDADAADDEGDDDEGEEDDISREDTEEGQHINLSSIFYIQICFDEEKQQNVIWLKTEYAFYRLEEPARIYAPFFEDTMTREVVSGDANAWADVYDEMESETGTSAAVYTNTNQWEDTYEDVGLQADTSAVAVVSTERAALAASKRQHNPKAARARTLPQPSDKGTAATEACVTQLIGTLAGELFNCGINVAGTGLDEAARALVDDEHHMVHDDGGADVELSWIGDAIESDEDVSYYAGATVNGFDVIVGDSVYVRNDEEEPWLGKVVYCFQEAQDMKFHIRYFARGKETILMETAGARELFLTDYCDALAMETIIGICPVQSIGASEDIPSHDYYYRLWYGSDLCLFEDAMTHEDPTTFSFSEDGPSCRSCDDKIKKEEKRASPKRIYHNSLPVRSITFKKQDYHENDFVYIVICQGDAQNVMKPVPNCKSTEPYHIGQIVSILDLPKNKSEPPLVNIRLMERYDSLLDQNPRITNRGNRIQKPVFKDRRRLVLTDVIRTFSLDALEGTCMVKYVPTEDEYSLEAQEALMEYKDKPDSYYYKEYLVRAEDDKGFVAATGSSPNLLLSRPGPSPAERRRFLVRLTDEGVITFEEETIVVEHLQPCEICDEKREIQQIKEEEFLEGVTKLRALDIFSGCGGLSSGLKESNVVETRYAIEFMTSAAQTYRHNFPGAKVYNDDANVLLSRAIDQHNGIKVLPRQDFAGDPLPDMPAPGDVDLIYCGPPCQGFSRMNRYQKANDLKNSLIATSLSYVDFYKPQYFLLENVRGLLAYRLGKEEELNGKWTGGIMMGVVKFILRCLTAMGYQCRIGLMQAGHQGLAQSRRRFFVWGAKIGASLPDFPLPSTCFAWNDSLKINPPKGLAGHRVFGYQRARNTQSPDPAVTVRDAIADLPGFEYINPFEVYKETEEQRQERLQEERWAFRELKRRRQRMHKQLVRKVEKFQVDCNLSDMDGYLSSTDEEEEAEEAEDEKRAVVAETRGQMVPGKPYFMQVSGVGPATGLGFTEWADENSQSDLVAKYHTRPQSDFQRLMRAKTGKVVMNHVARCYIALNVERICQVAMEPEQDHRSLPEALKPWCLSNPDSAAARHRDWAGLFGRLDFEGHFQTAVTDMQPMGKQGKVIHPNQLRVLSVREYARVQGFPDHFEFLAENGEVRHMYKQIGNAVPPPLAYALGVKLKEAMMENAEREKKWRKGKGKNRD